jgi:hypothetical protein
MHSNGVTDNPILIVGLEPAADNTVHYRINYSLALTCRFLDFDRVTAAAFKTVVPRSLTFVSIWRECCQYPNGPQSLTKLTKNDLISFSPHHRNQSLTRIDDVGKSVKQGGSRFSVSLTRRNGVTHRTFISMNEPKVFTICFPEMPKEQRPNVYYHHGDVFTWYVTSHTMQYRTFKATRRSEVRMYLVN